MERKEIIEILKKEKVIAPKAYYENNKSQIKKDCKDGKNGFDLCRDRWIEEFADLLTEPIEPNMSRLVVSAKNAQEQPDGEIIEYGKADTDKWLNHRYPQPEVSEGEFKKFLYKKFLPLCNKTKFKSDRQFATVLAEGYADDVIEWLQSHHPPSNSQESPKISEEKNCEWAYDENHCYYDTNCGEAYCLIEGTIAENNHMYCPYCGGKIKELNK